MMFVAPAHHDNVRVAARGATTYESPWRGTCFHVLDLVQVIMLPRAVTERLSAQNDLYEAKRPAR